MRLITLNYCPMGCTFCSATNFLHEAQGSVASIARLDADECLQMIERIVAAHPRVRTIIFQDDIFCYTRDQRILPLCEGIVAAKRAGRIPAHLQFISTNRIDAMSVERLTPCAAPVFACWASVSRVSRRKVLAEFNKAQIHRHIEPMLSAALEVGVTPFLDLILSSPRAHLRGCRGDSARGVPLVAARLRDRHVSLCHSVLRRRAGEGPEPRTSRAVCAARGCRNRRLVAAAGEDPAHRSRRGGRHSAHGAQLRDHARMPGERGGPSAFAGALAAVDSVLAAHHGRAGRVTSPRKRRCSRS